MKILNYTLLPLVAVSLIFYFLLRENNHWTDGRNFTQYDSPLLPFDLYDIGAAHIDADNRLDIYTVNHSSRQQVIFGGSRTSWFSDIGLGQVRGFPGAEAQENAPEYASPGLHIYRLGKNLHLKAHQLESLNISLPSKISINMPWPLKVISSNQATYELSIADAEYDKPFNRSKDTHVLNDVHTVEIFLEGSGLIELAGEQEILELPHEIIIHDEILRENVHIGGRAQRQLAKSVELLWRDRHAMIWRDLDNDGDSDVFIARGGVKGQLSSVPAIIRDEFLVRQDLESGDIAELAGIKKENCPARQTAWTDANVDGVLDIHISCGRVNSVTTHPDQLYVERAGRYINVAEQLGLDYPGVSVFKWADIDIDGDLDLLAAQSLSLVLYVNDNGVFRKQELIERLSSKPTQIIIADIDHDADLDAFVVQRKGSVVVINSDNIFSIESPESLGLPTELKSVSVVDFDNDGYLDMHLVPGGIYQATEPGIYEKFNELDDGASVDLISEARCVWIDKDMNGNLDVSCAVRRFPPKLKRVWMKLNDKQTETRYWSTHAAINDSDSGNNWLQIDLNAGALNSEAIGAVVSITTDEGTQIASVGQSDSAHYSQGHYRLYFGLGDSDDVENLTVYWPGGNQENYTVAEVNRLVELTQTTSKK